MRANRKVTRFATTILAAFLGTGCQATRADFTSEATLEHQKVVNVLNKELNFLKLLKEDYVESGRDKVESVDYAAFIVQSLLNLANDKTMQLLLLPCVKEGDRAIQISRISDMELLKLRSQLAHPSSRAAADLVYPGSMSQPHVIDFLRELLGIDLQDQAELQRPKGVN